MKSKPSRSDIFIIGGGVGGIAAAIASARDGSTVLLAAAENELGGRNGETHQEPFDFNFSTNDPFFRESGIFEEIIAEIRLENIEGNYVGQARALYSLIAREKNIQLKLGYHCYEANLNSSNNRIDSCLLVNHADGTRFLHRAAYFIDCSETAELSKIVGAPGENKIELNPDQNLFHSAALIEIEDSDHSLPFNPPEWLSYKWEDNELSARLAWMESLKNGFTGFHQLNWLNRHPPCPNSQELCWTAWDFLKNRSPLKDSVQNLSIKRIISVDKEAVEFRGTGDYCLSEQDLINCCEFNDSVAVSRAPLFKNKEARFSPVDQICLSSSFEIPLRALYSNKIKNLLWAGSHISCEANLAPSLSHPPTSAQVGFAVGYCASQCIAQKRLPRTISKEGHIHKFRAGLEKNNHRSGLKSFVNESNLAKLATVSASTTWQNSNLLTLTTEPGKETNSCLIQFPLVSTQLDYIKIKISPSEENQIFDARLLEGSEQNPHIPSVCLETLSVGTERPEEQWLCLDFNRQITHKSWHFIELTSAKTFRLTVGIDAPVGNLLQYPRKMLGASVTENPFSEFIVPLDFSPHPHRCAITELSPGQNCTDVTELLNAHSRPTSLPNLWISQPTNFTYPEFVEFHWPKPTAISRIDLFFDPSFGHHNPPYPRSLLNQSAPSLIKDYRIYLTSEEGKSYLLEEVRSNLLSHRTHIFEDRLIQSMEIEILRTHGLNRAQIFRVSCYE